MFAEAADAQWVHPASPPRQLLTAPQDGGVCQEVSPNLGGLDDEGERQLVVRVYLAGASSCGLDGGGVCGQVPGQRGTAWGQATISPAVAGTEPHLFSPHFSHPF